MQNTLYRRYQQVLNKRKYDTGGTMDNSDWLNKQKGLASAVNTVGSIGSGVIDATSPYDQFGYQSKGATIGKSALSGAETGAEIGSIIPGVGTLVGAGVGLVAGSISGIIKGASNDVKEKNAMDTSLVKTLQSQTARSNAELGANPELSTGFKNSTYFKTGGQMGRFVSCKLGGPMGGNAFNPNRSPLNDLITSGGHAKKLSSNNAEIIGKSHAQGGVQVPGLNSEVEGGETTKDNFVFSKALGFAQAHKPIAVSKGKIEKKVQTKERVNSLQRLSKRENDLAATQEQFKKQLGIS